MLVTELIEKITPLYSEYKLNKKDLSPVSAIEIMWDIGELLRMYIEEHSVKPHNLFRQIYGKSEGSVNLAQRSYIPREFQGRCYRIRRIFAKRGAIAKELPKLKSFTCFREAMPFFDNPKYKMEGAERLGLLKLLNSNMSSSRILADIRTLQNQKIGVRNPRTQRLHEVEQEKTAFVNVYNFVYRLLSTKDYGSIKKEVESTGSAFIKGLTRNVQALSDEGFKFFPVDVPDHVHGIWREFADTIEGLTSESDAKQRRRFRRLIPPQRIVRLADMLYTLLSEEAYQNFKKR
jgi:hypothetical protein